MKILKQLRERADLTLRQVEEVTGISNAYLSQLESGKIKSPSSQTMYILAKFYNYSLERLLIDSGAIQEKEIVTATMRPSIENRLTDIEKRLTILEKMDHRDPMTIPFT